MRLIRTKIITETLPNLLEEKINKWIEEEKPNILFQYVSVHPMFDRFHDGTVANQWCEYIFVANY